MMRIWGMSYKNGIRFVSENYTVRVKRGKENQPNLYYWQNSDKIFYRLLKKVSFLEKIPIFDGLFSMAKMLPTSIVLLSIAAIIFEIISFLFFPETESEVITYNLNDYLIFSVTSLLLALIIVSPSFHGAEHKVINAFINGADMSLEEVKSYSRISRGCGTNIVVFLLFFFGLSLIITKIFWINLTASFIFAFGILNFGNKNIKLIFNPLFKIGDILQKYILTKEPSDEQLKMGISAMNLLIELETGNKEPVFYGRV